MQRAAPFVIACAAFVLIGCGAPTTTAPASAPSGDPGSTSSAAVGRAATWTILDDAPLARLEMATAAHDGQIWMAGGLSVLGEAVNEVEAFDPSTGEWSAGPPLPTGIHHAALVSDGDRLLLIGGYLGGSMSQPTAIVLTLFDAADEWQEGPSLPDARAAGAAAWDGARVVYAGGVGPGGVSGDVFALETGAWERIGAMTRAREHFAAASDGAGRTWLLGGRVGSLESNLADVDLLKGSTITPLDPLPTPRGGVAAFFLPGVGACLTGGEAPDGAYTTVECIGPEGGIASGPAMNVRRHGHGAGVIGSSAYVVLGGPIPGLSAHTSVERLDVAR